MHVCLQEAVDRALPTWASVYRSERGVGGPPSFLFFSLLSSSPPSPWFVLVPVPAAEMPRAVWLRRVLVPIKAANPRGPDHL